MDRLHPKVLIQVAILRFSQSASRVHPTSKSTIDLKRYMIAVIFVST